MLRWLLAILLFVVLSADFVLAQTPANESSESFQSSDPGLPDEVTVVASDASPSAAGPDAGEEALRGGELVVCPAMLMPGQCQAWNKQSFLGLTSTGPGAGQFSVADDFTPASNAVIAGLCWWGFFGRGADDAPVNETFRIVFYADDDGVPSQLPIASYVTGVNATLSRSPHDFAHFYVYHANLLSPLPVQAATCYWLEVTTDSLGTLSGPGPSDHRFRWLTTPSGVGNDIVYQDNSSDPYLLSDIRLGRMAWCFDFQQAPVLCEPVGLPPNDQCAAATTITSGETLPGNNLLADVDGVAPCGTDLVNGPGVWYRLTAQPGMRYTASTCGSTDFDTIINVYCGTSCGWLRPVACNDESAGCSGGSVVTWVCELPQDYWLLVYGAAGAKGLFELTVTSESSIDDPVLCHDCPVDAGKAAILESDFLTCGTSTNGSCTTAETAVLGTTYGGSIDANDDVHDVDVWRFNLAVPTTVNLRINAQFPPRFRVTSGLCNLPPSDQITATGETCTPDVLATLPLAAGQHQVLITVLDFDYLPCGTSNEYVLLLTDAATEIPANDICHSAIEITPNTSVEGSNRFASPDLKPPCATNAVEGAGVWYHLTPQPGLRYTASTCGAGDFNTIVNVYCGPDCDNPAPVVCNNDGDDCPNQRSEASWVSGGSDDYWILVHGVEGAEGAFELSLTAEPSAEPPTPCAACQVDPFSAKVFEADLFDCGIDTNGSCANAEPLATGQLHGGTAHAAGGVVDTDVWLFTLPQSAMIDITIDAEFPPAFTLTSGGCGAETTVSAGVAEVCQVGPALTILLAAGDYRLAIRPAADEGVPCGAFNDYVLSVSESPPVTGACCRAGGICAQIPAAQCVPIVCDVTELLPPTFEGCFGDVDGNSVVNAGDRGFISASLDSTDPFVMCRYDLDGNGFVNAGDRGFIAANIGFCSPLPDYMNGSGLNHGLPDPRFLVTYLGDNTTCGQSSCP